MEFSLIIQFVIIMAVIQFEKMLNFVHLGNITKTH